MVRSFWTLSLFLPKALKLMDCFRHFEGEASFDTSTTMAKIADSDVRVIDAPTAVF